MTSIVSSAIGEVPPISALQQTLDASNLAYQESLHPPHLHHLAETILHDLQYQHEWSDLSIHTHSTITKLSLPRPVISGLPPRRAYIHPDEQVEILKAEHASSQKVEQRPEREWVLPTQLQEKMSLARFAAVFDALEVLPPGVGNVGIEEESTVGHQWQGKSRQKRLLLATLHDDSTVVYYIMHDGIVKPRQN